MRSYIKRIAFAATGLISLAVAQGALAAGAIAGGTIANTATVDYQVGGVSQTQVTSNNVTFRVDRKINVTVAEVSGAPTSSAPGSSNQATLFTVTNNSNTTLDFRLTGAQDNGAPPSPFTGTDNFDVTGVQVFVDSNDNGIYEPTLDTATFIDELAPDDEINVFVVASVPIARVNGDRSGVSLTATAAGAASNVATDNGTVPTAGTLAADSTETTGADSATNVDTVFADVAGRVEAARSGSHSAYDQYVVQAATITVTKTAVVISDPFNLTTNPKAIPGATIEYCIQVANTGGASATSVQVTDAMPANTTFVAGSLFAGGTVTGGVCNADGTAEDDDSAGADETDPNGANFNTGTTTMSATIPSVAASATTTARFRVTIN
jgi:uncharacterized repeat protein (TIGR01451 family)